MKLQDPGQFLLPRAALVELPPQRPLDVASVSGTLWLTLDEDPRDLVLERGERVLIEAQGRVMAYAMNDAVLQLRPVREPVTVAARRGFEMHGV